MSSNEWEQARAYVDQLRQKGRTDQQIRQIMLKGGWTEDQVEQLFARDVLRAPPPPPPGAPPPARTDAPHRPAAVPSAARRPRRPARAADISGSAKAGIILVSIFAPLAGFIWGVIYVFSGQAAKTRWGAWALVISVLFAPGHIALFFPVVAPIAGYGHSREQARRLACLSNMKQLAVAALMYSVDYGENGSYGPLPDAANWQQSFLPYTKTEQVFHCPKGGTYAMNPELSWRKVSEIPNPWETVLFYEVDNNGNPLYDVHMGKSNYAYVDGHAASREKSE